MDDPSIMQAEEALRLLLEAGSILTSFPDYETTLKRAVRLAVPSLADFCLFDLVLPEGQLQRVAWQHVDPMQDALFEQIFQLRPPISDKRHPLINMLTTGEPIFIPHADDAWLQESTISPQHLEFLRSIHFHSLMSVPLITRGRTIGILTFFLINKKGCYTEVDLALAMELGNRIALLVDNARLYKEAQEEITFRKQIEAERNRLLEREQEARAEAEAARQLLHDLFMQAPAMICVLRGPQHIFELANPLCLQLLGNRDVIGKPVREALPDFGGQMLFELLDEAYATGKPYIGNEIRVRFDRYLDGNLDEGFFNFVYQPSRNSKGEVDGILVHAVEVTALVNARQRVNEFLGVASHELKGPLTAIKASVQLARRQVGRHLNSTPVEAMSGNDRLGQQLQEAQEMLKRAEYQVDTQNRLINDLLDTARIQAGKLEVRPQPCDLIAIVQDIVANQRHAFPDRSFHLELMEVESAPIIADSDRIGQVISNYLSNAHRYSPPEQPVEIEVRIEGAEVHLSVHDRGPGIPLEEQALIWQRFYRGQEATRQRYGDTGLGLGLHICRMIIEQHHGSVGVESYPGQGATFWFCLPLSSA